MKTHEPSSRSPTALHEFAHTYRAGPLAGTGPWCFEAYWRRQEAGWPRELVWRVRRERNGLWSRETVEPGYPDTVVAFHGWPPAETHIESVFAGRTAARLFGARA